MNRADFIDKNFTNIALEKDTIDLYIVRKGLFTAVQQFLPLLKGQLLDVGCGIMPYREYILQNNKKVEKYTGVDFEASLSEEYAMGNPDFFWDGISLPFENNSYDCVLATELLEHCADPEMVLKEIYRVLKPGGVILITVPFIWTLHVVPHDEYRYTPFSMQRHIKNAGFKDVTIEALGGVDASLALMIGIWYRQADISHKKRKYFFPILKKIMLWLLKRDQRFDKKGFAKDNVMYTGMLAVAYK